MVINRSSQRGTKGGVLKKTILVSRCLFFIIILSLLGITSRVGSETVSPRNAKIENEKIDRLFKKVGILKVLSKSPPVEINLFDLKGRKVSLSEYKGKIVFLNFWTTWCPPCRYEMPMMEKLYRRLKKKAFKMIAINLKESKTVVKAFFKTHRLTFISLLDPRGETGLRFGIKSIPTTFILGKDGRIIGKALGPREWDSKTSIALFRYLIHGPTD